MNFEELPEFQRDFKKLSKKYKSLEGDLEIFKSVVAVMPNGNSKHFHVLTKAKALHVIKARLFCRYLKGSSLRIVYAYSEELQNITLLEMYAKGRKTNHNQARVDAFLSTRDKTSD